MGGPLKDNAVNLQVAAIVQILGFDFFCAFETGKEQTALLVGARNLSLSELLERLGIDLPDGLPDITLTTVAAEISSKQQFAFYSDIEFENSEKLFHLDYVKLPIRRLKLSCDVRPGKTYCSIEIEGFKTDDGMYTPFVDVPGFTSITIRTLKLSFELGKASSSKWELSADGRLDLVDTFILDGTISTTISGTDFLLKFMPSKSLIPIKIPEAGGIIIEVDSLEIRHDEVEKLLISSTIFLSYPLLHNSLPKAIRGVFPEKTKATFSAGNRGISITTDRLLEPLGIELPDIGIDGGKTIPVGQLFFSVSNLQVTIGKDVDVSADFGVGFPQGLNAIFGTRGNGSPQHNVFKCCKNKDDLNSYINLQISAGTGGICAVLGNSPFEGIELTKDEKDKKTVWWTIDMGEIGAFRFMMPTLSYDPKAGGFAAKGAFEITRPLAIPFAPVRSLLNDIGLDALASALPDSYPLQELQVIDDDFNFKAEELTGLIKEVIHDKEITDAIEAVVTEIGRNIDKLPDRFRRYLNISIPEKLYFDITVSTEGSVKFDISVKDAQPIKVLYPVLSPPLVSLEGIELRGLSFGLCLGGAAALVKADFRLDEFDLLTLGASLILPEDHSLPIPNPHDFQRTLIVDNLTMLIILATEIPIPIPIFYDELGVEYLGVEGVGLQSHFKFPMPEVNLLQLGGVLLDFIAFVSEADARMKPETLEENTQIHFNIGNNYLQLPEYLGGELLGYKGAEIKIKTFDILAHVMNAIKFSSINELIQAAPIDQRVGTRTVNFGPLGFGAQWLFTTPDEFRRGDYTSIGLESPDSLLKLITSGIKKAEPDKPGTADPEVSEEEGVVLFLSGNCELGSWASLESSFGLAASSGSGFKTAFQLKGNISNILDTEIAGAVAVADPDYEETFRLAGHTHLYILNRRVFEGNLQLSDKSFFIEGELALFPKASQLQVNGSLKGALSEDTFNLYGTIETTLLGKTLLNATAYLTKDEVYLQGQMLGAAAQLFVKPDKEDLIIHGDLSIDCWNILKAKTAIMITNNGFKAAATIEPIDLKFLKLSGSEPGTPLVAQIELGKDRIESLRADGLVEVLGISSKSCIMLDEHGFNLDLNGRIFDAWEARLSVSGNSLNGLKVSAELQGDLFQAICNGVNRIIKEMSTSVKGELTRAKEDVDKAQKGVDKLAAECERQRKIVRAEHERARADLNNAKNELSKAQGKVGEILHTIHYNEDLIRAYSKWSWQGTGIFKAYLPHKNAILVPGLQIAVVAEYVAYGIAQAALEVAKAVLTVAQAAVQVTPVDIDVRVSAPKALYDTATVALQTYKLILSGLEAGTDVVAGAVMAAMSYAADVQNQLISVQRAEFEGDLTGVSATSLVKLRLSIAFMGQEKTIQTVFSFKSIDESIKSITNTLLGLLGQPDLQPQVQHAEAAVGVQPLAARVSLSDVIPREMIIGVGAYDNYLYKRDSLHANWIGVVDSGSVLDVTVMNDGRLLGVGTDYQLYTRSELYTPWVKIPDSGSAVSVSTMKDGAILGVGTDGKLWTKTTLTTPWRPAPDQSGRILAVAVMHDGTILAVGMDNGLLTRKDLNTDWSVVPDEQEKVKAISIMNDGTILAVGMDGCLQTRKTLEHPWVAIKYSGCLIGVCSTS